MFPYLVLTMGTLKIDNKEHWFVPGVNNKPPIRQLR